MEQFEQLLTCAICLDRYRNPKLLPCQHSFCMEPCMDGLVDYVRRQVKCPECRAEHRIPYQGVQAFPTNVTLQRFLELHIEITGELPDPTSGQTMERCGVCSEKSYCSLCVHCDKKCCPECKDAHMDILRREITRINSQIRRGLHRLQDALALVEKNTLGLQTNCASVAEEVDEIYRRLSKALKDRTEHLRNEIERYSGTELRSLIQLKENLELEIANIQSNCDLADAHINENVPWDDAELLDTKELFLRTVEFIRNFEYEAGDYGRRVRFVMAHDPNQLVLHVAGYGELNIKPETGSGGHLGTTGGLAPPGGSPGLMRSKSDHRLASQYRQQEEERLTRNRYVPDYEYETTEYETPRNKSRYRSRFMRHRDGEESDGDTRSSVRFTSSSTTAEQSPRERVLDTEDAARGPLSGIFRLTDSPRVMKKLQECERAGKRKKEEPTPTSQPPAPKPQVQVKKTTTPVTKQTSEDDEISRIKKQNKSTPTQAETLEERQPIVPTTPIHTTPTRETEREPDDPPRRTSVASRRPSSDTRAPGVRSASSDSSTGSESSTGSGIRNTGAPFSAEEMKQKYLSRAPPPASTTTAVTTSTNAPSARDTSNVTPTSSPRPPFQSRFLGGGNRTAPSLPTPVAREEPIKKKTDDDDDDDDETTSSSEETETESEEESDTETHSTPATVTSTSQERTREAAMARTDIGPLLARSAEARRGSKEDSPSTRYSSPRGSPAHSASSPTSTPSGYTSRFVANAHDKQKLTTSNSVNTLMDNNVRSRIVINESDDMSPAISVNNCCPMGAGMLASNNHHTLDNNNDDDDVNDNGDDNNDDDDDDDDHDDDENDFSTNIKIPSIVIDHDVDENNEQILMTNDNNNNNSSNVMLNDDNTVDSIVQNDLTRQKIDNNIKRDDDKIDDFLARIVCDYNRSREGFERATRFGSDGEQRETSSDDSVSDELEAMTIEQNNHDGFLDVNDKNEEKKLENDILVDGCSNGGGNDEIYRRTLTRIVEESNEMEDDNVPITSATFQGGNISRDENKNECDGKNLISSSAVKIIEDEQELDTENLSEILSSVVKSARLMEIEYLKSHDDETGDNIQENNNNNNNNEDNNSDTVQIDDKEKGTVSVDNLFDDQGWVVTDEDLYNERRTISPNISRTSMNYFHDNENNDKTDYFRCDNDSVKINSITGNNDDKKLLASEINDINDDNNENDIINVSLNSSSEEVASWLDNVSEMKEILDADVSHMPKVESNDFMINDTEENFLSRNSNIPVNKNNLTRISSDNVADNSVPVTTSFSSSLLNWNTDNNNQTVTLNSTNISNDIETIIDEDNGGSIGENGWLVADELESNSEIVLSSNKLIKDIRNLLGNSEINEINDKSDVVVNEMLGDNDLSWSSLGEIHRDDASSNGSYEIQDDFGTVDHTISITKHDNGVMITKNINDMKNDESHGERPMNIPMQMVTTVVCVSVLCYGVLTNLFL